jgi:hypothetical protein
MYVEAGLYLTDTKNPELGYTVCVRDAVTGGELLHTDKHPVSGHPLQTAADALAVVSYYIGGYKS